MLSDKIGEVIWNPDEERIAKANLSRYMRSVSKLTGRAFTNYEELYGWSIDVPDQFWFSIWQFMQVISSQESEIILENRDQMPGARWFPGARLNFAENLLRFRDSYPALVFHNEAGDQRMLTYRVLYEHVSGLSKALRAAGVAPGDRVAAYMPNIPETVITMLAATSIGAVFSSCSPDFGVAGALERFAAIRPKIFVCADGYHYNGKVHATLDKAREIVTGLASVTHTLVVPYIEDQPELQGLRNPVLFGEFSKPDARLIRFEQLPFDHPVYILYSSGTTGKPKCIMHGAGGTLLQHMKELVLHTDLRREHGIFFYTTCGWMMWNWLVSSLAVGARVILWDGAPFSPNPGALFDLAEKERISEFGVSARYLAAAEKADVVPALTHHLPALRTICSTGSPLLPESYNYVYRDVKRNVCLSSISGGTDIISCFALGNSLLPVRRGELQCRGLGMSVQVLNPAGEPVIGEKGELVCTRPFPSMPIGLWADAGGKRFQQTYFDRFPGSWAHGDYAQVTEHGGMIIHGRADAVLNPGGVRIGTAEIYNHLAQFVQIEESLVIGQDWQDDQRIVLFVRLRDGAKLDDNLSSAIREVLRNQASPRHVPAHIIQVPDIPRTMSGKIVELAVRDVVHGKPVMNTDALANPEALEHFRDRPELAT